MIITAVLGMLFLLTALWSADFSREHSGKTKTLPAPTVPKPIAADNHYAMLRAADDYWKYRFEFQETGDYAVLEQMRQEITWESSEKTWPLFEDVNGAPLHAPAVAVIAPPANPVNHLAWAGTITEQLQNGGGAGGSGSCNTTTAMGSAPVYGGDQRGAVEIYQSMTAIQQQRSQFMSQDQEELETMDRAMAAMGRAMALPCNAASYTAQEIADMPVNSPEFARVRAELLDRRRSMWD